MNIKYLDLQAQYLSIKDEIDEAMAAVIDSSAFVLGPAVERFERAFAEYCGAGAAVGVNSGTSALLLILKGLNIGHGDEVITAANTFIATAAAIIKAGARPVLVDVDPVTRNIDVDLLEAAVSPKTRAIMPVHLYGRMADMPRIMEIAARHDLMVIEDAAQAHGASIEGRRAGTFGIAAGFSFYPGKNLGAYGEGGAVVTSNGELADRIRVLRDHGSSRKYFHELIGYNARMDGLQGAVLGVKLKHLDRWNRRRNQIADRYRRLLEKTPVVLPDRPSGYDQVYHQFVIEVENRDAFQDYLKQGGIPTMIHYPIPVHQQEGFLKAGFSGGPFPVTEKLAGDIVSLPIYPELSDDEVDFIASRINEFVSR